MKSSIAFFLIAAVIVVGCGRDSGPPGVTRVGISDVGSLPDAVESPAVDGMNWNVWRGPNRNGISVDQTPPTIWGKDQNVLWKTKVSGRGHASPTIVGDRIFLATADREAETQSVVCFDRNSGEVLWSKRVHQGNLTRRIHGNNSHASSTIAATSKHLFCVFINNSQVQLTKLDFEGEQIWQKSLGKFVCDYGFGYGASPVIWQSKLIVSAESRTDPFIVALNPNDGKQLWRIDRPSNTSFSTPVVANVAGKFQLLMSGGKMVKGYDPETGSELWSTPAEWNVTCGTMVWDKDIVFASGGFPRPQTVAIKGDGSAEVVWDQKLKCYEQSLLAVDGYVYGLTDSGICYCWKADTGEVMWKSRMKQGVSASPVYANGHLFFTTEDGTCFVIKASSEKYELVSENKLGDSVFATPTFVDNKIYMRVGEGAGSGRQEWLYCLGEKG